jgi:iron complex transport system substrate-binding protein
VVDRNGGVLGARIVALHPDLIVTGSSLEPGRVARVARSAEAPLYTQPDDSVADVEHAITELGLLTGKPIAARRLNAAIEADRRTVARRLRGVSPVRVFLDTGFFITVSDHTLAGDLLRRAGGRNVAGGSPEPGPFDLRELVHLDPQVYVATSDSETTLRNLRSNKATRKLTAIRNGRFAIVDTNLLDPGPQVGKGLLVLAHALHPDAFR